MVNVELKVALHDELRWARAAMLWKLDGLSEYDVRRPLTATGTNFLGLIKHLSMGESKYLDEVFGRPFREHHLVGRRRRRQRGQVGHRKRVPFRDHRALPARVRALGCHHRPA